MLRRKPFWVVLAAIILAPASIILWWLISPLFVSTTVEEELPLARSAVVPMNMTRDEVEKVMAGMAKVDQEMSEEMPHAITRAVAIKSGAFRDADAFHKGSGRATIYRLTDASHILRLENLKVTNGPALHVLLTQHPNPQTNAEVKPQGYMDLGRLKGNIGSQNYPIPGGVDLSAQKSVVIYCKPFQVIFSIAPLQDRT